MLLCTIQRQMWLTFPFNWSTSSHQSNVAIFNRLRYINMSSRFNRFQFIFTSVTWHLIEFQATTHFYIGKFNIWKDWYKSSFVQFIVIYQLLLFVSISMNCDRLQLKLIIEYYATVYRFSIYGIIIASRYTTFHPSIYRFIDTVFSQVWIPGKIN